MGKFTLGIDLGIGSCGWAVINPELLRLENIGVRLFDSSENSKERKRKSQMRRETRGGFRQTRRKHHRKERLKHLFSKLGLCQRDELEKWYKDGNAVYKKVCELNLENVYTTRDIYVLRSMALDYKLSMPELLAVIIHICNHRGYNPFYEEEGDTASDKKLMKSQSKVNEILARDGYRTVGEMYAKAPEFKNPKAGFENYVYVKNTAGDEKKGKAEKEEFYLIRREHTKHELSLILQKQAEFYPELNNEIEVYSEGENVRKTISERIEEIVFSQRDFEDGPGENVNGHAQKYSGFNMESNGRCMYYKNEYRGTRSSIIADLYAFVNVLSQSVYVDTKTGEIGLPGEVSSEILSEFIANGGLGKKDVSKILKKHGITANVGDVAKAVKFTNAIKKLIEECGLDWSEFTEDIIKDESLNTKNKLYRLSMCLSQNVTPKRRREALKELKFLNADIIKKLTTGKNKFGGTSNVSDKFMVEAIEAFKRGEAYGNFQAKKLAERFSDSDTVTYKKVPKINDVDMVNNPVVFRSLNEMRKVVNALISEYGDFAEIHIEVASELGKSFDGRSEIQKRQKQNEKNNEQLKAEIAELLDIPKNAVGKKDIDRYKLYKEQKCQCMYSGKAIDNVADVFDEQKYEIDHIIPFSLILDNTLNNKCLVLASENRKKGQRTPLEYFREIGRDEKGYLARVNELYSGKDDKLKHAYLLCESADPDNELLNQWKSRNINDTRYIAKYAVSMLSKLDGVKVVSVKGAITSMLRKRWLVWAKSGMDEYNRIEDVCRQLDNIDRSISKADDDGKASLEGDKQRLIEETKAEMEKEYGFDPDYTQGLIEDNIFEKNRDRTDMHHAVDATLIAMASERITVLMEDYNKLREIWKRISNKKSKYSDFVREFSKGMVNTDQYREYIDYLDNCKRRMKKYYGMSEDYTEYLLINGNSIKCPYKHIKDELLIRLMPDAELFDKYIYDCYDADFADGLYMPIVSMKPDRKLRGGLSDANAIPKSEAKEDMYKKEIGEDNYSYIKNNKYFCIEIYEDTDGNTKMRAIRRTDTVKKNKKLYLKTPLPTDYAKHIMYLKKNDYITVHDKKGKLKFEGFYQSVKNIKEKRIYIKVNNIPCNSTNKTIAVNDKLKKYDISLLGKRGGEIKCGEPLSSIRETE